MLGEYESCLVAYSGGVDSVLLAHVAYEELGRHMLAVIADSPSLPRRELDEAKAVAAEFGFPLEIVGTGEFENPDYHKNPVNRCYFCKHELFSHMESIAVQRSFRVLAYGENVSDAGDWRPGAQAAGEFEVRAPLREAGLSKADVREVSRALGLPTADKPAMPCLSSRIPYGERVTPEKVGMIEQAENTLRDMGFSEVRVRHHETGPLARVEVVPHEIGRLQLKETLEQVKASFNRIGYTEVEIDRAGYRRGSLNPAGVMK